MFRNENGQFGLSWIIGIGASAVVAFTGSLLTQNNIFNSKVDAVKIDVAANSERTARLEEAIKTLKTDNAEIKQDLKDILRILK